MTEFKLIATVTWALLILGYLFRKRKSLHVPLVLTAIIVDTILAIILQLDRAALMQPLNRSFTWMQWTHISFSLISFVLYLPTVILGILLLRGSESSRIRYLHLRVAIATLVARTIGFTFMFSM